MNCRALLCISVLVFCTTTSAAPSNVSVWLQAAKKTEFDRYRSTLLSAEVMPFLSTCYDPKCCEEDKNLVCSFYFDAINWAKDANFSVNVTKDLVATIPRPDVEEFCTSLLAMLSNISNSLGHKFSPPVANMDVTRCIIICGSVETKKARESCGVWSWLVGSIANFQAAQATLNQHKQVETNPGKNENAAVEAQSGNIERKGPPDSELTPKGAVHVASLNESSDKVHTALVKPDLKPNPNPSEQQNKVPSERTVPSKSPNNTVTSPTNFKEPYPPSSKPEIAPGSQEAAESDVKPPAQTPSTSNKTLADSTPITVSQDMDKKGQPTVMYDDGAEQADESSELDNSPIKVDSSDIGFSLKDVPQLRPDSREQDTVVEDQFKEEPSSNFFYYFLFGMFACILAYVVYNNKSKILALILEGRRSQNGRGGRRKHTAAYRKLDSNLEEAIMSAPSGRTSQIIY